MSSKTDSKEYVVRFSRWQRSEHALIMVLFTALILTGMPQKWPYVEPSRWIIAQLGGIQAARWLHRASGVAMGLLALAHVAILLAGVLLRRVQPTMLFTRADFTDAVHHLNYYLGRRPDPPRFGRYDYRQKFEYWGLLFGSTVMIVTGFILMYPMLFSHYLPSDLIPAAKVMHSSEALLAFLIVLIWHLYGAIFSPEVFPLDTSIFTGKISKERMKHEHPLEYEEKRVEP